MNTLTEPPSYPSSTRLRVALTHAKHPVFRRPNAKFLAHLRPLRRALPCPAF
jgi:hypothetical protein